MAPSISLLMARTPRCCNDVATGRPQYRLDLLPATPREQVHHGDEGSAEGLRDHAAHKRKRDGARDAVSAEVEEQGGARHHGRRKADREEQW